MSEPISNEKIFLLLEMIWADCCIPLVKKIIRGLNKDGEEEIRQQTFTVVVEKVESGGFKFDRMVEYRKRRPLMVPACFVPFVREVARRKAWSFRDQLARQRSRARTNCDAAIEGLSSDEQPQASVEADELCGVVNDCLHRLTSDQQILLMRFYVEDLGATQIGRLEGRSESTVRAQIQAAKAQFLRELREYASEYADQVSVEREVRNEQ